MPKTKILKQEDGEDSQSESPQDQMYDDTYYDYMWEDKNGNTYFAFNMEGMLFWNYYATYVSLFTHLVIHALMGFWCSWSKVVLFYSFQVCLLHAYSWAIPDRRYAHWVKERRNWFYFASMANIVFYFAGIFGGLYLYVESTDGIKQFTGFSCIAYTFISQTLMVIMFAVNYYTLARRFDYEKNGYHGHVDYPPKDIDEEYPPQKPVVEAESNLLL